MLKRRRSRNNLRKRKRLIAKLSATPVDAEDGGGDVFDALTSDDRRAVAAARNIPDSHPVVSKRPLDVPGGWLGGGYYVYANVVEGLRERFLPNERLNFGPLFDNPPFFHGRSAADIFEYLLRAQRAAEDVPVQTIDIAEFFDGNGDPGSIAANVVDADKGPSFELIRETLLDVAKRPGVAAVGVEIGELPNPDVPQDDDQWPSAERVFIWTAERLTVVRRWLKALRPDGVGRADPKSVCTPDGNRLPEKVGLYEVVWD